VASGVINPVTGRRIVTTWMIDELMPFAVNAYQQLGKELAVPLIKQCNVLDFHPTPQMQIAFDERLKEDDSYLQYPDNPEQWRQYFNYPLGIGEINPCYLVDLRTMLSSWREVLRKNNQLIEEHIAVETVIKQYPHATIIFAMALLLLKATTLIYYPLHLIKEKH